MFEHSDCFWLLSAIIEFTHHSNLYSAFKETTSESFQSTAADALLMPSRVDDLKFFKYSKVMKANGETSNLEECSKSIYEPEYPIKMIPTQSIPNKSNLYNFLILNPSRTEDDREEIVIGERAKSDQNQKFSRTARRKSSNTNTTFDDYNFPLIASIAVLLVLVFFIYRLFFSKKRVSSKFAMRKANRNKLYFND